MTEREPTILLQFLSALLERSRHMTQTFHKLA